MRNKLILAGAALAVGVWFAFGGTFSSLGSNATVCPVYVSAVDAGVVEQVAACQALIAVNAADAGCVEVYEDASVCEDGGCEDAYSGTTCSGDAARVDTGGCSPDAADYDAYAVAETPPTMIRGTGGFSSVTVQNQSSTAKVYLGGSDVRTTNGLEICRGTGCTHGAHAVDVLQGRLYCVSSANTLDGGGVDGFVPGTPVRVLWGL